MSGWKFAWRVSCWRSFPAYPSMLGKGVSAGEHLLAPRSPLRSVFTALSQALLQWLRLLHLLSGCLTAVSSLPFSVQLNFHQPSGSPLQHTVGLLEFQGTSLFLINTCISLSREIEGIIDSVMSFPRLRGYKVPLCPSLNSNPVFPPFHRTPSSLPSSIVSSFSLGFHVTQRA